MEFFDLLVGFETDLWNAVERDLSQAGHVGLGTLTALRVLHRHGANGRVHDVSTGLSITVGAASKLVDRLERDGLVARRANPDDRRSSLIALTTDGDRARRSGERVAGRTLASLFGDDVDVASACVVLERLRSRIASVRASGTADDPH